MKESMDSVPERIPSEKINQMLPDCIVDTQNNFFQFRLGLQNPSSWPTPPKAQSLREYLWAKYPSPPGLADALRGACGEVFTKTFDDFAEQINEATGTHITSEDQVDAIRRIAEEAMKFIQSYRPA